MTMEASAHAVRQELHGRVLVEALRRVRSMWTSRFSTDTASRALAAAR